jgi:hypothetical protein
LLPIRILACHAMTRTSKRSIFFIFFISLSPTIQERTRNQFFFQKKNKNSTDDEGGCKQIYMLVCNCNTTCSVMLSRSSILASLESREPAGCWEDSRQACMGTSYPPIISRRRYILQFGGQFLFVFLFVLLATHVSYMYWRCSSSGYFNFFLLIWCVLLFKKNHLKRYTEEKGAIDRPVSIDRTDWRYRWI